MFCSGQDKHDWFICAKRSLNLNKSVEKYVNQQSHVKREPQINHNNVSHGSQVKRDTPAALFSGFGGERGFREPTVLVKEWVLSNACWLNWCYYLVYKGAVLHCIAGEWMFLLREMWNRMHERQLQTMSKTSVTVGVLIENNFPFNPHHKWSLRSLSQTFSHYSQEWNYKHLQKVTIVQQSDPASPQKEHAAQTFLNISSLLAGSLQNTDNDTVSFWETPICLWLSIITERHFLTTAVPRGFQMCSHYRSIEGQLFPPFYEGEVRLKTLPNVRPTGHKVSNL